jgi:hypothetical protein
VIIALGLAVPGHLFLIVLGCTANGVTVHRGGVYAERGRQVLGKWLGNKAVVS